MALLHNTVIQSATLGRRLTGIEPQLSLSPLNRAEGKNFYTGWHSPNKTSGMPNGHLHPSSWKMPMKSGGLSCYTTVTGSGAVTANALAVKLAQASLTGSGDLTAFGSLVVQLIASISGSGTVSNADLKAFLQALANISGSGTVTGTSTAFGELLAALVGDGTATGSTLTGVGELEATIRGYGDLTPEGIRDSVWNALAASYNTAGTMGAKLNSAASGGVDYNALAAAVWEYVIESGISAEQAMRIYGAVLAGKVSGAGTGTEVFTGLDGTTVRVTSVVDSNGNRTSVTVNGA